LSPIRFFGDSTHADDDRKAKIEDENKQMRRLRVLVDLTFREPIAQDND